MTIQECVVESIQRAVPELEASVIGEMLEIPPDKKMGDYAFPCFRLAKQFRKAPALIAQDVSRSKPWVLMSMFLSIRRRLWS